MFIYKNWRKFCNNLNEKSIHSVTAESLLVQKQEPFIILKHDVETKVSKALKLAKIENEYNQKGSYYVQAYLLKDKKNVERLRKIQELGHEVSYHHDVMDKCEGNIKLAENEFQNNIHLFHKYGFKINTVCQHGNPIKTRMGYTSNRDFFRNCKISKKYSTISELMVNYKARIGTDYKYISDAGYGWKIIFDPENNDIIHSDHKNIPLNNLEEVIKMVKDNQSIILSTHPHRWYRYTLIAKFRGCIFDIIKRIVKLMIKIPIIKRIFNKFFYLAKKI